MKMKKKLKRLCSLLVVLTLVLAATAPVFATTGPTGTITLHTGDQDVESVTFKAYRLMDATVAGTNVGYSINSDFAEFFKINAVPTENTSKDFAAYEYLREHVKTEAFKTKLKDYIKENSLTVIGTEGKKVDKTVIFDDLPYGYYAIIPTSTAVDTQTLSPSFVTLSNDTATANLKGLTPGADKKVVESADSKKEWGDATIGKAVEFEVTSLVPDMTGETEYHFKLVDTMSKGLTVTEDTLNPKVQIGNTPLVKNTDFTVTIGELDFEGKTTVTIDINDFTSYQKNAGETITFTYKAILNEEAVSSNPETNTAHVEYGNDPNQLTKSDKDTVNVRTYDLTIEKYAENIEGVLLGGAEFKLYQRTDEKTLIKFVEEDKTKGIYRVAKEGEASAVVDKVVTPDNGDNKGIITIKGLDQGNYILEETKAPDGYNKLTDEISVIITAKSNDEDKGTQVTVEGNNPKVVNKAGILLPGTGGMGTLLFTLVGVAGVAAILYSFVVSKKKTHGEE